VIFVSAQIQKACTDVTSDRKSRWCVVWCDCGV